MKVLTLNVWGRRGPPQRLPLLEEAILSLDPDLLCLQEVPDPPFFSVLADRLECPARFHAPSSGLALLSRLPAETDRVFTYEAHSVSLRESTTRQALMVRLAVPSLWVITTHLSWTPEDERTRLAQAEELLRELSPLTDPILLCGDFNAPPETAPIARIREAGFQDLFARLHPSDPGITWDNANPFIQSHSVRFPDRRIDYLFLKAGSADPFEPTGCEVVCSRPAPEGIFPSDHYGVFATLRR